MTKEQEQKLIKVSLETGRFYLSCSYLILGEKWCVGLHYHRNCFKEFLFTSELAYEMFLTKLEQYKGYIDYQLFYKECDNVDDLDEAVKSLYVAALK